MSRRVDLAFLDRWQRQVPLTARPFAEIADREGMTEARVIAHLRSLVSSGVLTRVGAVVRPHTAGSSTLAAMKVPAERLKDVAEAVSALDAVTHNYEREHAFNLWFVVAGPDRAVVTGTLARLRAAYPWPLIDLPLEKAYHLDLGFPVASRDDRPRADSRTTRPAAVDPIDRAILAEIEDGIPLEARPFLAVGSRVAMTEDDVIRRLGHLVDTGVVARFGLVVRHRAIGYRANGMVVWDVPDLVVDSFATRVSRDRHVTLCYRRPRRMPDWPYNLFCMIHGRSRSEVRAAADDLAAMADGADLPRAVLFSRTCFKQRGAVFSRKQEFSYAGS